MTDGQETPDRRIRRLLENAEVVALKALTLGRGSHPLDPASGHDEACVDFSTADLTQALVILFHNGLPMYFFNIDITISRQHLDPDELRNSNE